MMKAHNKRKQSQTDLLRNSFKSSKRMRALIKMDEAKEVCRNRNIWRGIII